MWDTSQGLLPYRMQLVVAQDPMPRCGTRGVTVRVPSATMGQTQLRNSSTRREPKENVSWESKSLAKSNHSTCWKKLPKSVKSFWSVINWKLITESWKEHKPKMGQHTFIVQLLTLNLFQQLSLAYVTGVKKKDNKTTNKIWFPKKFWSPTCQTGYRCLQSTHIPSRNKKDDLMWYLATSALQKLQVADASYKIKTKIETIT